MTLRARKDKAVSSDRRKKDILATLRDGQKHMRMICDAIDFDYIRIRPLLVELIRDGEVIILGTARQAGLTGMNTSAPVYGLPGMTLQRAEQQPAGKSNDFGFAEDIRVAQRRTIPMYHSNGWSRLV